MGWEYSGNPATSDKDKVRFYIGDTDPNNQQLQDEEIEYLLTDTSAELATIAAIEQLIVRYTPLVDRTIGSLSITYSQRLTQYRQLLKDLKAKFGVPVAILATPYAGGIRVADKDAKASDTTMESPLFTREQA